MDEHTTFAALRKRVSDFRDERDWLKDNTPKNLGNFDYRRSRQNS